MNDELTAVLRERAERGADPGVAAVWDSAVADAGPRRRRRRNRSHVLAVLAVTGVLLAALVIAVSREDSTNIAIAPRRHTPTTAPNRPTEVSDAAGTVHLTLPQGWTRTPEPTATTPPALLTVGTNPQGPPFFECTNGTPRGTWLIIYEYQNYQEGAPLPVPGGATLFGSQRPLAPGDIVDRPADFLHHIVGNRDTYIGCNDAEGNDILGIVVDSLFRDGGRVFLARFVAIDPHAPGDEGTFITTPAALRMGYRVLDSLRVTPATP